MFPRHRGKILVQRRDRPDAPDPRWSALTAASRGEPETVVRQRLHAATGVPKTAMAVARAGEPLEVTADGSLVPVLVDTEEQGNTDGPGWEWIAPPSLRFASNEANSTGRGIEPVCQGPPAYCSHIASKPGLPPPSVSLSAIAVPSPGMISLEKYPVLLTMTVDTSMSFEAVAAIASKGIAHSAPVSGSSEFR